MKKIFTFCFVALSAMMAQAQVAVTFNVDMTGQTVDANGVHMAGNFNDVNYDGTVENAAYVNWNPGNQPGSIALADQGNGIWSVTLNLVAERYEFKFINGNDWPFEEDVPPACQVEVAGNDNRFWSISGLNATESMTVCYASCAACGENTVRFRVDMTQEAAGVNPAGIFVAGDFQGWNPAGSQLIDPTGDGTFEGYFSIGAATSAQFKFINGNDWVFAEAIPAECNVSGNRVIDVVEANTVVDVICFSACGPCQAPTPVLFRVDMTLQTVNADGPHVAGSFQGWNPGDAATLMTDPDGDNIYEVTLLLQPGTYQYKFVNGDEWADGDESLPADCNVGGNREVVVAADPGVEHFCYSQCGAECVTDPDPADITFRVNMFTTAPSADGVWLIGGFTNPAWQAGATQMTDADSDGVYECTINVSGLADIQYKFVNGDVTVPANEESVGIANCGIENGIGGYNRVHTRSGIAEVLTTVCFDSCADCIIGIQEAMALTVLNAFPVPANEFVTLSFGQVKSAPITVRVMNNLGQVVSSQYMGNLPVGNNQIRVDLQDVSSGIYAIEISNGLDKTAIQIAVQ